ncbi:MAG: Crp/Fnr family transcriptional regulator [Micropepsaceae bacterium]
MRVSCHECPLRAMAAFRDKPVEEVDFIQRMKTDHLVFRPGDAIVRQGSRSAQLFTLFSGWAFRFKELSDGRRQILNFLLPGDLVGFQNRLFEDSPYGVEALTNAEVCVFARSKVWDLYRGYPELAYDVTWLTAHEESFIDENLLTAGRRNAAERAAVLMMHLAKRIALLRPSSPAPYAIPINQSHIADALGLSLAHTNKTLKGLEKRGLFRFTNGCLEMLNPKALARLADYYEQPIGQRPLI